MKETYHMRARTESVIGDETFTTEVSARLDKAGGSYSLSYTEKRDCGRVFTTLTYTPGGRRVSMKCRGAVKSEMVFDPSTPHTSTYQVEPLAFPLTVTCREIETTLDEHGGHICLVYERALAGDTAEVTFRLTAEPAEEDV